MRWTTENQPKERGKKQPTGKVRLVVRVKTETKEYFGKHRIGGKVLDEYVQKLKEE